MRNQTEVHLTSNHSKLRMQPAAKAHIGALSESGAATTSVRGHKWLEKMIKDSQSKASAVAAKRAVVRRDLAGLLMQLSMSCIRTNGLRKMSRNWCDARLNYLCQRSLSCSAGLPELRWRQ